MKPPQRPVGALVIAILNFVFGGFGLMGIVCGGLYVLFVVIVLSVAPIPPPPPGQPDPMGPPRLLLEELQAIPGFIPYVAISAIQSFVMPFLLLISGYGLVKMRPYGRSLAIFYAILTLVIVLCNAAYTLAFFNENFVNAYQHYFDGLMAAGQRPGGPPPPQINIKQLLSPAVMTGSTIFMTLIYSAYPIAILAVMYRRDVRAAYSGLAPVVLPSRGKRSERTASPDEEVVVDALPGARPALEDGIKQPTDPGLTAPKEDVS